MLWFIFSQCFRHYIWVSIGINKTNRFDRIKSIWSSFSVVSWVCNAWLSDRVLFLRLHCVFCCQVNQTTGKRMCTCTTLSFISSMLREKGGRWERTQQTKLQSAKSRCFSMWWILGSPLKRCWHICPFYHNKLKNVLIGLRRSFSNYSRHMLHSG